MFLNEALPRRGHFKNIKFITYVLYAGENGRVLIYCI